MRSLGWLNAHLKEVLDGTIWGAITNPDRRLVDFDRVAVSVCCGVEPGSQRLCGFHVDQHHVPPDLKEKFERRVNGRPVTLMNDAEAWMRGALAIADLKGVAVQWPSLALSFGTGVGYALACGPGAIEPREFCEPLHPVRLSRAAGREGLHPWDVHGILGKPFFDWVERDQHDWSYVDIRRAYTDRLVGLLKDLAEQSVAPKTLFVGGGYAEYVSVHQVQDATGICTVPMVKPILGRMSPDLIPLFGILKI